MVDLGTLILRDPEPITGVVLSPDGDPVSGARVRVEELLLEGIERWGHRSPEREPSPLVETRTDRSGRFVDVAQENQKGVVWVLHQWGLFSKETGKPLYYTGRDAEGNPIVAKEPPGPGGTLLTRVSSGSGFAVDSKGHILTNRHVARPWEITPELTAAGITGRTV